MLDLEAVRRHLHSIGEHLREAEAAAEVIADGDPTAAGELSLELDGMAQDIAVLKSGLGSTF